MKPNPVPSFPASTYEEWKAAAESLLKGAPFDKVMLTRTPDGIVKQPIYLKESLDPSGPAGTLPGADGYLRGARPDGYRMTPWEIAQDIPAADPAEFNRALLSDLARGQDAVNLTPDSATRAGLDPDSARPGDVATDGLSIASLADLGRALRGVVPEAVTLHFRAGAGGLALEALFLAWLEEKKADPARIRGSLGMDPLAVLADTGSLPQPLATSYDEMAALVRHNSTALPGFRAVGADGFPYHDAGASSTQEIGILLATGTAYLRALAERGVSIDDAARQIRFTVAIGPDFFLEIAKLRALRPLWTRIVRELGGSADAARPVTHARTGRYNKTLHDPYVNLLRTTTEALSGVIGGADSLHVAPFDECLGAADEFSRRIARNTQIILQEECELTAVIDPAGGSWYIEALTQQVAEKAWDFFRAIEGQGGLAAALENGFLRNAIAAVHDEAVGQLAQRRRALVGTNQYPNLGEADPAVCTADAAALHARRAREVAAHRVSAEAHADAEILAALTRVSESDGLLAPLQQAAAAGATIGELTRAARAGITASASVEKLPDLRLAEGYEALRAASRSYRSREGHGPKLHLATLGALRRHKPRADFIRAFFETGGFEISYPAGSAEPDAVAATAAASGARLIVICGHDEDYPTLVPPVLAALRAAVPGATLLLAGHPGDHEAAFRAAGLDDFVTVKSNNHETNRRHLTALGVISAE